MTATTFTEQDFAALTDPLRRELTAHCYRMLGSVHDAEDQVQETYLRAWRAFGSFEGRSSVRTWMYQIATNTCLTALEQRARRPMPTGLGAPASDPLAPLEARPEVPWLEPVPDALVTGPGSDPAGVAATRDSVRLALVAALQLLTPLQRAVLVLRDVLAFSAAETADILEISVPSANSALQRARAGLARRPGEDDVTVGALDARARALLEDYMDAFEQYDTRRIAALLKQDATWEMPPFTGWYQGAEQIVDLIKGNCPAARAFDMRMLPVEANGQPACAMWMLGPDGVHRAFQLQVLDVVVDPATGVLRVGHVAAFFDTALFTTFGLPLVWPDDAELAASLPDAPHPANPHS